MVYVPWVADRQTATKEVRLAFFLLRAPKRYEGGVFLCHNGKHEQSRTMQSRPSLCDLRPVCREWGWNTGNTHANTRAHTHKDSWYVHIFLDSIWGLSNCGERRKASRPITAIEAKIEGKQSGAVSLNRLSKVFFFLNSIVPGWIISQCVVENQCSQKIFFSFEWTRYCRRKHAISHFFRYIELLGAAVENSQFVVSSWKTFAF